MSGNDYHAAPLKKSGEKFNFWVDFSIKGEYKVKFKN
jgi:hypothetical protein